MSYRFAGFEGRALIQLNKLPPEVLDAVVDRVVDLLDAPWDADIAYPGNDPTLRETTFGAGLGLLSFRLDHATELIWIYHIAWIG